MARPAKIKKSEQVTALLGFEAKLWLAADKLRNSRDAVEYRHVGLGLIFLKYISDSFEECLVKELEGQFAESAKLETAIRANLKYLGFSL